MLRIALSGGDPQGCQKALARLPHAEFAADVDDCNAVVLHAASDEACRQAAEAGRHVLADRPVGEAAIDACAAAGVRLMIGFTHRFSPSIQTVKAELDSGALGEPGLLRIQ